MISNAFGIIYTGDSNMHLRDLTNSRSVAAVPFGGRYRCIDFVLSNMVNSGIDNVGVIAQRNYHSLMDHLGSGKEWDLHRKRDGLFILPPFVTKENTGLYRGTIDALKSVSGYIRRSTQKYVVLSGSHTIFNCPFNEAIAQHIQSGADVTLMYNEDPSFEPEDQFKDLRLHVDAAGRVINMEFDPYRPTSNLQSMNALIMEKTLLEYLVEEAASHGMYHFHRDILLRNMNTLKIYGYRYNGFVARMTSLNSYFKSNMALLRDDVRRDVFNPDHPIYTKVKDEVPACYGKNAVARNSIVADGCVIEGEIDNCVLFRGVHVGAGAYLKNCIVMQASEIQEKAHLEDVIMDKSVVVKRGRNLIGHESFPIVLRKGSMV
ncbi:MAG: glucose-1-phosphate adenylyltransferase subunit GlgD [Eubacteriales bacterium]|nr:glucose-1-phosphate adenylyltransferase subunit GlgD [Eubacteriales bacterium]